MPEHPRDPAVIVDVDGTLCDVTTIRHHVVLTHPDNRGYKDFNAFHHASVWCPPIAATVAEVKTHRDAGRAILIVTARKERWRPHTTGWLEGIVEFDELHMRADDDDRPDAAVKADILQRIRARGWDVVHAIDDNPSIIKLWRMEGIPVTEVPGWIG